MIFGKKSQLGDSKFSIVLFLSRNEVYRVSQKNRPIGKA